MTRTLIFYISIFLASALMQSCKEPTTSPEPTAEQEKITTVKLEFKDTANGQFLNYYFRDMDMEGPKPPSQLDTIILNTNTTYLVSTKFINEANPNGIINVTSEVKAEEKHHIVCYSTTNSSIIIRTDSDGIYPLGLETKWFNGSASTGKLSIILKHQPGMKDGSCDLGSTDVQVDFPLIVR